MMYASENEFIRDFAERTKANLELLADGPYEVTQLINSTVGLLIIPREKCFNSITDNLIKPELLTRMKNNIGVHTHEGEESIESIDLQKICRHMRNAVAHGNIDFKAEKSPLTSGPLTIHSVVFTDTNPHNSTEQFKINVSIGLLKEFLFAFSDAISNLQSV